MKKVSIFLFLLAASFTTFAQTTWKNDKMHSQLKFDITHLGVSTVAGSYTDFDVTIKTTKDDFSDAVFELTAKTASIETGVEPRNTHLKSPDFFDAASFPVITYKSTSIKKVKEGNYKLTGDLTIHGVTKSVTMDLWYRGTVTNPMSKQPDAGFRLTGSLKRSDFGIGGKFPEAMLSEVVNITADGEFGKQ